MRSAFKIGLWFLAAGLLVLLVVAVDMFHEYGGGGEVKLLPTVTVDGKIKPGEYTNHFFDKKTKYNLYWRIEGDKIYFGMHSPKKGWVAVGLGAKKAMQDADIYIAYVKNGKAHLSEEWGNTPFSHIPIKNTGEKSVVEKYAGSIASNGVSIEFVRPLKVNGKHAKSITNKKMNVIFAYSTAKDFTTYHGAGSRGSTKINFFAKPVQKKSSGLKMWVEDVKSYQIAGIVWGVLFLMVAFIAFVSGWIERDVSVPIHIKKDVVGTGPFVSILLLILLDFTLIVAFVVELFIKTTPSTRGFTASLIFFILAIVVALYRRYYIDERVVVHDLDDELPW